MNTKNKQKLFSFSNKKYSYSVCCSSNDFVNIGLLDGGGVIAIGIESFHWTSPNWISIGSVENWIVGCIETGSWGIDDDIIGRLVNDVNGLFLRLLSNVNDCDVPPINSYSSVEEDVVGVISSLIFDDVNGISFNLVLLLFE